MATLSASINASEVKVLIVDDIPLNVMLIEKMLKKFGFVILKANSGHDALKLIESEKPHLMFLDLMMPGMSGYDVLENVRQNISGEQLPIVILSALNSNDDIAKAMNLGANDFITKPVVMERLHNTTINLLNQIFG